MAGTHSLLKTLACRACCTEVDPDQLTGVCRTCGHTLFAGYRFEGFDGKSWWSGLAGRPTSLWRYRELLPVGEEASIVSLGEGGSPLLRLNGGEDSEGLELWAKDDGGLPTGSFKARGMTVAVSRAVELGAQRLFVPSAGNAGLALAAYAAAAHVPAVVYLPAAAEERAVEGVVRYGAKVVRFGATIREAGEEARRREQQRAFDMSTMREPYRVEGKKTMAFEIAEQSGPDHLPDVIIYPTGGGTGLVGLNKGFGELRQLGLIDRVPRLVAVQSEGCAPVVRALKEDSARVTPWTEAKTIAPGLAVPSPFSSERVLEAVRATHGTGVAVSDAKILAAQRAMASSYGLSVSIEAAAPLASVPELRRSGVLRAGDRVVLYLTGRGA